MKIPIDESKNKRIYNLTNTPRELSRSESILFVIIYVVSGIISVIGTLFMLTIIFGD